MRSSRRLAGLIVASAALHLLALLVVAELDWTLPTPDTPLIVRVVPVQPQATRRVPAQPDLVPAVPPDRAQPPNSATPASPPDRPPPVTQREPTAQPAPRAVPAPTPPPERPRGQVVDLPDRPRPGERTVRPPADTRYLSERDRVVERETVARATPGRPDRPPGPGDAPDTEARVQEGRVAAPAPTPPPTREAPAAPGETQIVRVEPARPAVPATPPPPAASVTPAPPAAPAEPPRRGVPREALPAPTPSTTARASRAGPEPDGSGDGDAPAPQPRPGLDRLLPGPERLARLSPSDTARRGGGGGTVRDYIPNVEEGEETFLNSREFRYAYYFNQVKRAIAQQWDPGGVLRRAYPNGANLGRSPMTELMLVVEKDGRVGRLEVSQASGVEVLDREALRAVRAAGTFPAPPAGLLDPDGKLRFPFGFIVTTGGGGRLTFYGPDDADLQGLFRDPFGRGRSARPSR
jgi:TonB family protein